jgi:GH15 family glucan-1,4-alpha-glucosidase
MARSVVLGNSGLTVGLNEKGLVHDFYYPYVGLENLTTARVPFHHIGIWVDGGFSWLHDSKWSVSADFQSDVLVSFITMKSEELGLELLFEDFVDCHYDIFARKVTIKNSRDRLRDIRLFFHQNFQISAQGRADTAMYVPKGHYLLDYKGRCSILAYAETSEGVAFDQYAAGNAGIEDKEGTFRDAEDGELSMSAVEHGGVDSTLRVCAEVQPQGQAIVHYWLAVADTQTRLEQLHSYMLEGGFKERMHATRQHWQDWLSTADKNLHHVDEELSIAVRKSLMTIKAHTDLHGGIIASCDSSIYNYGRDYYSYVWPRDGAFVMWPLIKLGYTHEPKSFFNFCRSIMHPDGYLMHKYQPDRAIGSTWHPLIHGRRKELAIQEDETAVVVYMLSEYLKYSGDSEFVKSLYDTLIQPACNFMCRFIDPETGLPHASYDLWEEKFLTSTYTTAVTYQALVRATDIAAKFDEHADQELWSHTAQLLHQGADTFYDTEKNSLIKGFLYSAEDPKSDSVLDVSSFFAGWKFAYSSQEHLASTLNRIETELLDVSPSGGSPRYEDDNYFKSDPAYRGNPWFVTTLWLAQYYASTGQKDRARKYVDWSLKHAMPSRLLSEQVEPESGKIVGVTPLVWSHAELINTILDLN